MNSTQCISDVTDGCSMCSSVKKIPPELFEQSSSPPANAPGEKLAADVVCREKQKIMVVRDTLSSYTAATFIANETADEYKDALIICCLPMKVTSASVRVDCAPSLKCLSKDKDLVSMGIILDLGSAKNPNKNPVAEKANQELELELLKTIPGGVPVSAASLTKAVAVLNARIRKTGLSAKEMLFGRDQVSGERLQFTDDQLAESQVSARTKNHLYSSKSKAGPKGQVAIEAEVGVGSLVFIKHDGSKFRCRETYIVVSVKGSSAMLQKMNGGKLMSTQYEVPLTKLMLCQKQADMNEKAAGPCSIDCDSSSSDSSDNFDSDSDASVNVPPPREPSVETQVPGVSSRPVRNRRRPDRYGSCTYDPSVPILGEDDVIPAWGPNCSKDAWAAHE